MGSDDYYPFPGGSLIRGILLCDGFLFVFRTGGWCRWLVPIPNPAITNARVCRLDNNVRKSARDSDSSARASEKNTMLAQRGFCLSEAKPQMSVARGQI